MIRLTNVTIFGKGRDKRLILNDTSMTFLSNSRIGILASPRSGKTTLARHLSGLEKPDQGWIEQFGNVSWPLGNAGFLHPHLTIQQNLATLSKLKNIPTSKYLLWCTDFAGLSGFEHLKVVDLSPSERAQLAYACVVCLPWDQLVVDETITVGDPIMRMKCDAVLDEHRKKAGLIFISRNAARLREYCEIFLVHIQGQLRACADLDTAQHALSLSSEQTEEQFAHV